MSVDILGTSETNAEAWFNKPLRPRKPEGSLGRTAQDGHLDSHTAPELCRSRSKHGAQRPQKARIDFAGVCCMSQ